MTPGEKRWKRIFVASTVFAFEVIVFFPLWKEVASGKGELAFLPFVIAVFSFLVAILLLANLATSCFGANIFKLLGIYGRKKDIGRKKKNRQFDKIL